MRRMNGAAFEGEKTSNFGAKNAVVERSPVPLSWVAARNQHQVKLSGAGANSAGVAAAKTGTSWGPQCCFCVGVGWWLSLEAGTLC